MTDSRILGYDPNYGEVRMVTDCDDMTMERKIIPHRALVSPTPRPLDALAYEILFLTSVAFPRPRVESVCCVLLQTGKLRHQLAKSPCPNQATNQCGALKGQGF